MLSKLQSGFRILPKTVIFPLNQQMENLLRETIQPKTIGDRLCLLSKCFILIGEFYAT